MTMLPFLSCTWCQAQDGDEHIGMLERVNVANDRSEDAQGRGAVDESFGQNNMKPPEEDMTCFQANCDRSTGKRMGLVVRQDLNVKLLPIKI